MSQPSNIAVLLPCYNEEPCIAGVVTAFRQSLPEAVVYVYDNNSRDKTAQAAQDAGAIVRKETYQGKGNVVRRMFSDIEAGIYVIADGDGTYDASAAPELIRKLIEENLDMVVASRMETESNAYRHGHKLGNYCLTGMVKYLFGFGFTDILSGYRVLSRRYVKSFPIASSGFEIETEMSVHALQLRLPVAEISTHYGVRLKESPSKLNTYRDGFRVLMTIFSLMASERPRLLFGTIAAGFAMVSVVMAIPSFGDLDTDRSGSPISDSDFLRGNHVACRNGVGLWLVAPCRDARTCRNQTFGISRTTSRFPRYR